MKQNMLLLSVLLSAFSTYVAATEQSATQPATEPLVTQLQNVLRDPRIQDSFVQMIRERFARNLAGGRIHGLIRAGKYVLELINDGNFSDALGLILDGREDASAQGDQEPLPENPTLMQRANHYAKNFGSHEVWYLSPLIELGEVLALDSKSMAGQFTGALAGQLSGVAATPVPGPDYFFNTYYRIPERVRRITRSQDIARVIRELPGEEQKRLRSVRNAQLISLALSGGLRVAQLANKKTLNNNLLSVPLYIASMIIAWRRHKAIGREYGRLLKRAQLFLRQRDLEEKERDRQLDQQLKEMRLKEMDIANHTDQSGGDNEEERAV